MLLNLLDMLYFLLILGCLNLALGGRDGKHSETGEIEFFFIFKIHK